MLNNFLVTFTVVLLIYNDIIQIHSNYSKSQCGSNYGKCDPDHSKPCCKRYQECVLIEQLEQYYCISYSGLGMECNEDDDCVNMNTRCSRVSQTCICEENYVTLNNVSCLAVLGGACDVDDDCISNNSVCSNKKCVCKDNLISISNVECAKIYLELPCQKDEDCHDIDRIICSENKTCVCRPNSIAVYNQCSSLIGGSCKNDHNCMEMNTLCKDNECQCKQSFLPSDNSECILSYLNQPCKTNQDCYDTDRAMCSENKTCICRPNHQSFDNSTCLSLIGGFCWHTDECFPKNSFCMFDRCRCSPNFKADKSNHKCLKKLGTFCEIDEDCEEIRHAKCSKNKTCVCREDNIAVDDAACLPLLGQFCWNNELCAVNNSVCVNNKCQCKAGFHMRSKYKCLGPTEKQFLGKTCRLVDECGPNSFCIHKRCQCRFGFVKSGNVCVRATLGDFCEIDQDCAAVTHAMCSKDNICICRSKNIQVNSTKCIPLLGEFCWKNEVCIDLNSDCVNNVCQCKDNYIQHSEYQCL